ncbi:L,D-transpeptidase [Rhodoplanes sp. Z2-YC6860]|uniref:L,D-transpeptidase n=1 Tax=Rhodoplanes sp. Z2-YC6860 TaxID=674703 RepID=UPI00078DCDCD|nr:L,D-transpeptidase [Rhodoplanes sp. Z2-YC6860]AMN41996.1 ErfK/YbiS/YcfS/YnhG protein [Rhodoplanes sp. Z2-YC6860]
MSRLSIHTTVALAATLVASTAAHAEPLGYAPWFGQQGPIFQQITPDREDAEMTKELPDRFRRQIVNYQTREAPGTIVIDTPHTRLYYVLGGGKAISYGIGVGRDGFTWSGVQSIARKSEWPDWIPPEEMLQRQPYLPRFMAGGPSNPLGARAMYLGNTVYRIHGTNAPETIGSHVSSGCIRMVNEDVIDLYNRVNVGTKVIVLPDRPRLEAKVPHAAPPQAQARLSVAGANSVRPFSLY